MAFKVGHAIRRKLDPKRTDEERAASARYARERRVKRAIEAGKIPGRTGPKPIYATEEERKAAKRLSSQRGRAKRTREQRDSANAHARQKAAAAALASGRIPGRTGQPPKNRTAEELREIRRIKSAKWRAENRKRSREIGREAMRRASAKKAIADGRLAGQKGRAPLYTEEEKRAKRREKNRKYYYANLERSRAIAAAKERRRRAEIAAGIYQPRDTSPRSHEHRRRQGRAHAANRRARVRGNGGSHKEQDILDLHTEQKGRCAICGNMLEAEYHVDHIVPLARGGSNDPENLQLTHPFCNMSKGAKLLAELKEVG